MAAVMNMRQTYTVKHIQKGLTLLNHKVVQHAWRKIWYNIQLNMSGEMHMRRRRDVKVRCSAAYPTAAEHINDGLFLGSSEVMSLSNRLEDIFE